MTALYERYLGCAAFHPTNDNIVLLFGGRNEHGTIMKTAFKVHLDDGSHHNLKDLDFERSYHTCMGFVKKDGRPVSSLHFKKFYRKISAMIIWILNFSVYYDCWGKRK